jgi:hypothetical protein
MTRIGFARILVASLVLTLTLPSVASAQRGHRVLRDWTVGVEPWRFANDGHNSDYRRIGLTEYEGDVTGTFISWGFGGVKTEWSAPAIAGVAAAPFSLCLLVAALACGSSMRSRGKNSGAAEN